MPIYTFKNKQIANERDLDIRCVRLKPDKLGEEFLLNIEQIIPSPEVEEYQVRGVHERVSFGFVTLLRLLRLLSTTHPPFSDPAIHRPLIPRI